MSSVASTFLTPEEYLERERLADYKSEYCGGEVFAMAGASFAHSLIVTNLLGELSHKLRQRPCVVYSSGLRLAITASDLYTYPDAMVICDKPASIDTHMDTVTNPTVIVEVFSPSTERYDRCRKFESYRSIWSLMEYVTVSQEKMHIEVNTRQPDNSWLLRALSGSGSVKLQSIEVELQLFDIYEKVEFTPN